MKINIRTLYSLIAFVALFTYLYPVALRGLPIDTGECLHLFGILYVVIYKKGCLPYRFYRMILWALPLLCVGWAATTVFNDAYDFSLLPKLIAIILYSFSAVMVVDLIRKATKSFSVYTVLEWVVYAAIVQAVLSFILFFNPDLMDIWVTAMKQSEVAENIAQGSATFRLMAVSKSQYANMAVAYGLALFAAIALAFSGKSVLYSKHKLLFYLFLLLIFIAGILSARTFFLLLIVAGFYFSYELFRKKGASAIVYIGIAVAVFVGLFFSALHFLENSEYERTYKWAFEWYINLSESGRLETSSTDTLHSMFIFPDNLKTWLLGDGRMSEPSGSFYMSTDVGYLRSLYYWGGVGTLLFYFIQYMYYRIVVGATDIPLLKRLCGLILIWMFFYSIKDFWNANLYWALLLAAITAANHRPLPRKNLN